jgi:Glycosyl transferase family 21
LMYYAGALVSAWAFFGKRDQPGPEFTPPLSLLKPLRGSNRETYGNLASFCRQDYPCYEILFCVHQADDPAIPVIRHLREEFPRLSIRLSIGSSVPGANDKVSKVCRLAREALHAMGGFEVLAEAAADDYELGHRVAAQGFRVEWTRTVPETECSTHDFRSYFRHHLRWAVVTRTSQPWGHGGFLLVQGLPWVITAAVIAPSGRAAAALPAAFLALRVALAFTLGSWGLRDPLVKRKWWLLPLRDALGFVISLASLFVSRVHWQDAAYDVSRGRLIPVPTRRAAGDPPSTRTASTAHR